MIRAIMTLAAVCATIVVTSSAFGDAGRKQPSCEENLAVYRRLAGHLDAQRRAVEWEIAKTLATMQAEIDKLRAENEAMRKALGER